MFDYEYSNVVTAPALDDLDSDIQVSAMTDKETPGAGWIEDTGILKVYFTNELSAGDKTILDGIVSAYQG